MARTPNLKVLLPAASLVWVALAFVGLGLSALVLDAAELVPQAASFASNAIVIAAAETFVYLVLAFAFFAVVRRLGAPAWFALAGPVGYLLYQGIFLGMTRIAGGVVTFAAGELQVIAVDVVAVTVGAAAGSWAGARGRGRAQDEPPGPGSADEDEAPE